MIVLYNWKHFLKNLLNWMIFTMRRKFVKIVTFRGRYWPFGTCWVNKFTLLDFDCTIATANDKRITTYVTCMYTGRCPLRWPSVHSVPYKSAISNYKLNLLKNSALPPQAFDGPCYCDRLKIKTERIFYQILRQLTELADELFSLFTLHIC